MLTVIHTARSVSLLPTNGLDRPFHYEAVLKVADKAEVLLTAADCLTLGESLISIGHSKEARD